MSSPASSSDSSSFERLHPEVQQWVWSQGWTSLRDAQEWAVPALVGADRDVIIAASTAAGKTEAAFLPILTNLLNDSEHAGAVLYISPLKALINDQWDRLSRLCERLELPVVAWHGDVAASKKQRFLKSPEGILLITPESLEALFVNRGSSLPGAFQNLRYIVVDELHAFIGSERGKQLQSLMQRVEIVVGRALPRVGLSATLGEMSLARKFLRPVRPGDITVIESKSSGQELQVQVRGYIEQPMQQLMSEHRGNASTDEGAEKEDTSGTKVAIAGHLYKVLRGHNNLIFPNRRQEVEWFADRLRSLCENDGVPNEFWPHHGSLSKELRQDAERALKAGDPPASAVCTTTLELGIDIGNIRTVAQIGCPPSVASLRQRLGRSGRRPGEPAMLRAYCRERPLTDQSDLSDQLREGLVQTIAMIRLLTNGWFEPPRSGGLHASTLVQQCLSSIAQLGGASAVQLWGSLIASGSFASITKPDFLSLLKGMGEKELIVQDSSGLLLPGKLGERLINHYEFYTAFTSDEEFRLLRDGKPLGSLPVSKPLTKGQRIIFGGRRWQVQDVDLEAKVIVVTPARGGEPPQFDGLGAQVDDRVRLEMRNVLMETTSCPFLDKHAQGLLEEARSNFRALGLGGTAIVGSASVSHVATWRGDYTNDALALLLRHVGIQCENTGLFLEVAFDGEDTLRALRVVGQMDISDVEPILENVENMIREKWDWALPRSLLMKSFASSHLDLQAAVDTARLLSPEL
ncbi:DEAD/DEAH box helicase [Pseudomonas gingeri]|uniref:DEAD/DEAH box helicase n=1 Tax=Pseudomonas gingeri TaxID=117681 RepID=UPI0015A1FFAA|nr:DEAD/DEAH box helicase [Pseudomonas gingeri]NWE30044.1 DEAD/DEAH box helicase [Pseudomonas gingeri]NWE99485.1 DEAD/DEAH box helicase [Pseudomonas gingeri]